MKILKTLSKRGLALFLVLTMCFGFLPAAALAAEIEEASHTHNEDGWTCVEGSRLICGYEEHTHGETCWETGEASDEPVCGLEESEGHAHTDACYTEETTLVCDLEESEEHEHDGACYTAGEPSLTCGQEETEGHAHNDGCYAAVEGEKTLVCELEEHEHGDKCYESEWTCAEPTEAVSRFLRAVKAIPDEITAEDEAVIADARSAYDALTGEEKANHSVVDAYAVLTDAEAALETAEAEAEEDPAAPGEEIPEAVQAFLDAVAELPEEMTRENLEEAEALIEACETAEASLSGTELERSDVLEAKALLDAAKERAEALRDSDEPGEPSDQTVRADVDGLTFRVSGEMPANAELKVVKVEDEDRDYLFGKTNLADLFSGRTTYTYDMRLLVNGEEWQPEDEVTVSIEGMDAFEEGDVSVYHFMTPVEAIQYARSNVISQFIQGLFQGGAFFAQVKKIAGTIANGSLNWEELSDTLSFGRNGAISFRTRSFSTYAVTSNSTLLYQSDSGDILVYWQRTKWSAGSGDVKVTVKVDGETKVDNQKFQGIPWTAGRLYVKASNCDCYAEESKMTAVKIAGTQYYSTTLNEKGAKITLNIARDKIKDDIKIGEYGTFHWKKDVAENCAFPRIVKVYVNGQDTGYRQEILTPKSMNNGDYGLEYWFTVEDSAYNRSYKIDPPSALIETDPYSDIKILLTTACKCGFSETCTCKGGCDHTPDKPGKDCTTLGDTQIQTGYGIIEYKKPTGKGYNLTVNVYVNGERAYEGEQLRIQSGMAGCLNFYVKDGYYYYSTQINGSGYDLDTKSDASSWVQSTGYISIVLDNVFNDDAYRDYDNVLDIYLCTFENRVRLDVTRLDANSFNHMNGYWVKYKAWDPKTNANRLWSYYVGSDHFATHKAIYVPKYVDVMIQADCDPGWEVDYWYCANAWTHNVTLRECQEEELKAQKMSQEEIDKILLDQSDYNNGDKRKVYGNACVLYDGSTQLTDIIVSVAEPIPSIRVVGIFDLLSGGSITVNGSNKGVRYYQRATGDGTTRTTKAMTFTPSTGHVLQKVTEGSLVNGTELSLSQEEKVNGWTYGTKSFAVSKLNGPKLIYVVAFTERNTCLYSHEGETGKLIRTENATCTMPGHKYWRCEGCGFTWKTVIPALGHLYTAPWSYDSTNHWRVCGRDWNGDGKADCTVRLETAKHTFGAWKDNGNKTRTHACTTCRYSVTEPIPTGNFKVILTLKGITADQLPAGATFTWNYYECKAESSISHWGNCYAPYTLIGGVISGLQGCDYTLKDTRQLTVANADSISTSGTNCTLTWSVDVNRSKSFQWAMSYSNIVPGGYSMTSFERWTVNTDGSKDSVSTNNRITFPALTNLGNVKKTYVDVTYEKATPSQKTVTFDLNGGKLSNHTTNWSINQVVGTRIENPGNPTKDGYNFLYWYRTDVSKTPWDFDVNLMPNQNITLKAEYEKLTANVSVTFIDKDGATILWTGNIETGTKVPTENVPVTQPPKSEEEGYGPNAYTFSWNTKPDGTGTTFDPETNAVNDDLTVYAVYVRKTYTVTFDLMGGVFEKDGEIDTSPQTVSYGDFASQPSGTVAWAGTNKTFDGWYLNGDTFDFFTPITKDVTLYAGSYQGDYSLHYDLNGGSVNAGENLDPPEKFGTGKMTSLLTAAQCQEKGLRFGENVFMGWSKTPKSLIWKRQDADAARSELITEVTFESENITVYAVWATRAALERDLTVKHIGLDENGNEAKVIKTVPETALLGETVMRSRLLGDDAKGWVYAKYEPASQETHQETSKEITIGDGENVIKFWYEKDENDDNIPDKYQKKVELKVQHGWWNSFDGNKDSASKIKYLTFYKDSQPSNDSDAQGALNTLFQWGDIVGKNPFQGYRSGYAPSLWSLWDKTLELLKDTVTWKEYTDAGVTFYNPAVYTYAYSELDAEYKTLAVEYVDGDKGKNDTGRTIDGISSTVEAGKSVEVGLTKDKWILVGREDAGRTVSEIPDSELTADKTALVVTVSDDTTITLVYTKDENENKIPDKYEATVTFQVHGEGAAWADGTTDEKTIYVELKNSEDKWDENGSYVLAEKDVPKTKLVTAPAAGSWNVASVVGQEIRKAGATYTYTVTAGVGYTVKYVCGGTEIATAKTDGSGPVGSTVTVSAIEIAGYNKPAATSQTITLDADATKNVITFVYTARTDLSYTVKYLEKDTNEVLADEETRTGKTFGETYEETAKPVTGYNVDFNKKSITIGAESGNELIFVYAKRTDLSYTIRYYKDSVTATTEGMEDPCFLGNETVTGQTYLSQITLTAEQLDAKQPAGYKAGVQQGEASYVQVEGSVVNVLYEKDMATVTYSKFEDEDNNGEPDKKPATETDKMATVQVQKTKTVTANLDGGTWTATGWTAVEGTTDQFTKTVYGDFTLETPTKDGYVFVGWKMTKDETDGTPNGNVTFTAQWAEDTKGGTDPETGEETGDGIPDKYQKKVTFVVVNGTWSDRTTADKTVYVELKDSEGKWSANGSGTFTKPTGMIAKAGFTGGEWTESTDQETDSGTIEAANTYLAAPDGSEGDVENADLVTVTGTASVTYTYTFSEDMATITYPKFEDENGDGEPDKKPATETDKMATVPVQKTKTVTANLNGGTWTAADWTEVAGTTDQFTKVVETDIILDTTPTKTGFVFMGWVLTEDKGDDGTPNGNVTFTAQWAEDTKGGTNPETGEETGDDIPDKYQKKVTFKVEHGTFTGGSKTERIVYVELKDTHGKWSTSGSGALTAPAGAEMHADGGYAGGKWKEPVPGTVEGMENAEYIYAFEADMQDVKYSKFQGEGEDPEGKPEAATIQVQKTKTVTAKLEGGSWSAEETAKWTESNGNYTKVVGDEVITLIDPAKDGYVFVGWKMTADETDGAPNGNVTFTAQWAEDTKGKFDEDGKETGDDIPDKYQKKITFVVVNGTWSDGTTDNQMVYVELKDENGKWSADGSGTFTKPTGMIAKAGFTGGEWTESTDQETDSGTIEAANTYLAAPDGSEGDVENADLVTVTGTAGVTYTYTFSKDMATVTYLKFEDEDEGGNPDKDPENDTVPVQKTKTVTVDLNGGKWTDDQKDGWTNADGKFTKTVDGDFTLETPTRNGYIFMGWVLTEEEVDGEKTGDVTFTAKWTEDKKGGTDPKTGEETGDGIPDKYQKKVTFVVVNGTWSDGKTADRTKVFTLYEKAGNVWNKKDPAPTLGSSIPTGMTPNAGYTATGSGWNRTITARTPVTGNVTYTFTFPAAPAPTPDPVTPVIPVTPSYPTGGGTTTIPGGATPLAPTGTTITDGDVPLAAPGLNSTDHFDYIKGYSDGTVRPEASITRAEVATIFFRLMTNDFRTANWAAENDFSDVQSGDWYNNAVSTCAKAGILKGYTDGTFKPNDPITRAEFASIAASFASEEVPSGGMFSDIEGHWAQKSIERAAAAGWIKGSDGKFRPNDQITRAEVIVTVNRMLDRVPDAAYLLADMKTFSDNTPDKWYYADVQEATNSHDYERAEDGVTGIWTELLPEQDWTALEKEWATAADANVVDVAEGLRSEEESSEDDAADDGE